MIRIGILGDIGSGKSYVAKKFGYPVFNADEEVGKLYKKDKNIFLKLKKILPKHVHSFPINKNELIKAILGNKNNLKKIIKVIHAGRRKKIYTLIKKNKNKDFLVLDIPLFLENKINKKKDILIYVEANKLDILKRLKKRKNFNQKLLKKFKSIQLPITYKKKKSHYIVKNNFTKKSVNHGIKKILKEIR